MPNKDGGYRLPLIIDPERICIQVYVPNEMNHLLAFWAQLEMLGSALSWANDPDHTALLVAAVWKDVFKTARDQYYDGGCMTDNCCPETNEKLDSVNVNLQTIIQMLKGGATISFNAQEQSSDFVVNCTPDNFTGNEGETPVEKIKRQNALCLAVNRWLVSILGNRADKMNKTSLLNDIWALGGFTSPPKMYAQIQYVEFAFTIAQLQSIIDSETAFQAVACLIIQELANEGNTFSIFKKLMQNVYDEVSAEENVEMTLVALAAKNYAADRVNYTLFSQELERAYEDIEDGDDYACLCFGGVCDPDEFVLVPTTDGTTVEKLSATVWRVTQNTFTLTEDGKRLYRAGIRDAYWRCMNNYSSSTAYSGYDQYNCAGVHMVGTGGGGGFIIQMIMDYYEYVIDPQVGFTTDLTIICP